MTKTKSLGLWTMRAVLATSLIHAAPAHAQRNGQSFDQYMDEISSSGLMKPRDLSVIMDNKAAFEEKIRVLNASQAGDTVFMTYYIHDSDATTSKINQAILAAAKRGARVHLVVDFLTNYNQLDTFNMLKAAGGEGVDIRFFNPPTDAIHRDAIYLTMDCGPGAAKCREEKEKEMKVALAGDAQAGRKANHLIGPGHFFSRLFLAGLSGKRPEALKTALAEGATLPDVGGGGAKPSAEEKAQLLEFAKLVFGAKVMQYTTDKIKLAVAMLLYGEDVKPIYDKLDSALPLSVNRESPSGKDWEAITQFTHQKATVRIAADGRLMQSVTGGRNLQASYHVNENMREMTPKYLFADTDISYSTTDKAGIAKTAGAFNRLLNSDMVVPLEQVNRYLPVDYIMEIETIKKVIAENKILKGTMGAASYSALIEGKVAEALAGKAKARQAKEYARMSEAAAKYDAAVAKAAANTIEGQMPRATFTLDPRDRDAKVAYVENLTFREATSMEKTKNRVAEFFGAGPRSNEVRVYDPSEGQEVFDNKRIQADWIASFKHQAAEAARERKVRTLYITQGYLFPSSNIIKLFGEMMDGTINSEFIKIKILTNSIETTDLSAINLLARHQLKALMEYHDQNMGRPGVLKNFEIFELNLPEHGRKTSLHSKAMYLHDTAHIGSANAEVRSARTDTNNEIVLIDAPETVAKMTAHVEKVLNDPQIATNVTKTFRRPHTLFLQEDPLIVRKILSKYKGVNARLENYSNEIAGLLMRQTTEVYLMTGLIVDHARAETWLGRASTVFNPEGGGGGGASAAGAGTGGNQCSKVLLGKASARAKSAPEYLNTGGETFKQIRALKSKYGPKEIGPLFDRIMQLI